MKKSLLLTGMFFVTTVLIMAGKVEQACAETVVGPPQNYSSTAQFTRNEPQSAIPAPRSPGFALTADSETTDKQETQSDIRGSLPARTEDGVVKEEATAPAALPARPLPTERPQIPAQSETRPRIVPGQLTSPATTLEPHQQQPRLIEPTRTPTAVTPAEVRHEDSSLTTPRTWYEQSETILERQDATPSADSRPWHQQQPPSMTDPLPGTKEPRFGVPVPQEPEAVVDRARDMRPVQQETRLQEDLSEQQRVRIQQRLEEVGRRIEIGFEGHERRKLQMEQELQQIAEIQDSAQRRRAITDYQQRHRTFYNEALQRANVNISEVVQDLRRIAPELHFSVDPDLSNGDQPTDTVRGVPVQVIFPTDDPSITSQELRNFNFTSERSCRVAAGGAVTHRSNRIEATARSAVAGGCSNWGELSHALDLAGASRAHLDLRFTLHVDTLAVGAGGMAQSCASASVRPRIRRVQICVLAPFLWVAHDAQEIAVSKERVEVPPDAATLDFYVLTDSWGAAGGGSSAKAEISNIDATLVLER